MSPFVDLLLETRFVVRSLLNPPGGWHLIRLVLLTTLIFDDFEVGVGGPERCRYVGQLAIFKLQMFQLLHGGEAEAGLRVLIEDAGDVGQVVPRQFECFKAWQCFNESGESVWHHKLVVSKV